MKNKIFFKIFFIIIFCASNWLNLYSKELDILSNLIELKDNGDTTIFTGNVLVNDDKGNQLSTEKAIYNKKKDEIKTFDKTNIVTSDGYLIKGSNITFDNINNKISSLNKTEIIDRDNNSMYLKMFEYNTDSGFIFSKGDIEIKDTRNSKYKFSEIYIDQKKRQIVGTDVKTFLGDMYKIDPENDPRFFSNTVLISDDLREFNKGIFTFCKDRGEEKCPVWSIQAEKIKHEVAKKTIYYDNAVLKIFDFPIFYFPKFFHPDPTVDRQTGLLAPIYRDSSNLGSSVSIPFFWAKDLDSDFTITPKIYSNENPLFFVEYRKAFENSSLVVDAGYTEGYKDIFGNRTAGSRTHFFSKFVRTKDNNNFFSNLEVDIQKSSNDTYLKVHDVNNILAKEEQEILENRFEYFYGSEDLNFGLTFLMSEDLNKKDNLRYEYLLPSLTLDKNLLTDNKIGIIDWISNVQVRNFDVNNQTEFFVNDINWSSNSKKTKFGANNLLKAQVKTTSYNADVEADKSYKGTGGQTEVSASLGYLASLPLIKSSANYTSRLTPKFLLKYAPGHMRDIRSTDGYRLTYDRIFDINKSGVLDVIDTGLGASLGFSYKLSSKQTEKNSGRDILELNLGQVFNEQYNFDMPDKTSLNKKSSDLVGSLTYNVNNNNNLKFNYNLDENYSDLNFAEIQANINLNKFKFNISYLEERGHIGNNNYASTGFDYRMTEKSNFSFQTKRNFETNSAEFYNLSYEYINDCLRAGLIFRREFYTDKDLNDEDTILFKVTFRPFESISSPNLK